MRRSHLQALADAKLRDAQILLVNDRYSSAYYLGGYAVELGLKACIAKQFTAESIPERNFVNAVYSHKLPDLLALAGLRPELQEKKDQDPDFATNWALVVQWEPQTRYADFDPFTAQSLIQAIGADESGVLPWIKRYW